MDLQFVFDGLQQVVLDSGFMALTWGHLVMWAIGLTLLYLAIAKGLEPYLLLPIGFGVLLVNLPLSGLLNGLPGHPAEPLGFLRILFYAIEFEVVPPMIFLGLGAMTDFGPLIANPKTMILGGGAQFGVFIAFFGAILLGFTPEEAASIGIIGGADGPTTIFLTNKLAPHLLGVTAVSAYSYMALVPLIIPPIIRLFTTEAERKIQMPAPKNVNRRAKILFPLIAMFLVSLLVPQATTLMGMFMLGNLMRETGVVKRLSDEAQNGMTNIATILLGLGVSVMMTAEEFLQWAVIKVFILGLTAFVFSVVGGLLLAKLMNLFLKQKINPMIGAAGLSAVPMAARIVQVEGMKANPRNYLLMHAMGPNVAGVIGTLIAAGMFLALLK